MKAFIVVVVLVGLSAVVGAVVIGSLSFDGTVVEDPYETGLKWDEERKFKEALGYSLNVDMRDLVARKKSKLTFMVMDRGGRPLDLTEAEGAMMVRFVRPSTDRYKIEPAFAGLGSGVIGVVLELPEPGLWDMSVEMKAGGRSVVLEKRVFAQSAP